jgi:hypothetical protein
VYFLFSLAVVMFASSSRNVALSHTELGGLEDL